MRPPASLVEHTPVRIRALWKHLPVFQSRSQRASIQEVIHQAAKMLKYALYEAPKRDIKDVSNLHGRAPNIA
jgi:hypothetical protein